MAISFIEIHIKVTLIFKEFHKISQTFNLKRIAFSSKILCKLTASHWGTESLQSYGLAWIVKFTIIFRTSRYSDISWYEHFTLVHMQGDTSLQTVVANSFLKKKLGSVITRLSTPHLSNIYPKANSNKT